MKDNEPARYKNEFQRCSSILLYYSKIRDVAYSGDWGDTLYDFLCPEDEETDYTEELSYFAPLAAALSDGQRAALQFVSLTALLRVAADSASVTEADLPSTDEIFKNAKGEKLDSISIYSGINRGIFRKGVALTDNARTQKSLGKDPYDDIWDLGGMVDIAFYSTLGIGVVSVVSGAIVYSWANSMFKEEAEMVTYYDGTLKDTYGKINSWNTSDFDKERLLKMGYDDLERYDKHLASAEKYEKITVGGKWLIGIGAALMIAASILKAVQMTQYYNRPFTPIPMTLSSSPIMRSSSATVRR